MPEDQSVIHPPAHNHHRSRQRGGQSELAEDGPPAGSSKECRRFLRVAAVLGPTFALDDVSALLHQSVASLLPTIDELLDAGIINVCADAFVFRDMRTWREAVSSIPRPALRLLRREAEAAHLSAAPFAGDHPGAGVPVNAAGHPAPGVDAAGSGARAAGSDSNPVSDTVVLSNLRWADGFAGEALELGSEAVELIDADTSPHDGVCARLSLASKFVGLRQPDRARPLIEAARRSAIGLPERRAAVEACAAHWLVTQGRLGEARATAQTALREDRTADKGADSGASLHSQIAHAVLALVNLREGDLDSANAHAQHLRADSAHAGLFSTSFPEWVAFLAATGDVGPVHALDILDARFSGLPNRRSLWCEEPAAGPWLVRTALAGGDRRRGEQIADRVEQLAASPRQAPLLAEIAAHCRALLDGDAVGLEHAATRHADRWSAALAAEDLALLLRDRGEKTGAVRHWLESSLRHFKALGMRRDAQRVCELLARGGARDLAADAGGGDSSREGEGGDGAGWEDLTETERKVAVLASEGLTNRQISERLYVSPHTVNYHLRRIFQKFGINSRVGLARRTPPAD